MVLPVELARRLALHAQGLAVPPGGRAGFQSVEDVVARIGCLQLDPVSAVARSPMLVLNARMRSVREDDLDAAAYRRRQLFDYWAHEASLVHVDDLAVHAWAMRRPLHRPAWAEFFARNERWVDWLLAELAARGPLRVSDIEEEAPAQWEHGWWTDEVSHRQTVGRLLHGLWLGGRIGVFDREASGARRWHLLSECLPPAALDLVPELDEREVTRRAARRAIRMLGVARAPHIRAHFTRGKYPLLEEVLPSIAVPVSVDGLRGQWWALEEDLEGASSLEPGRRTVALSPFDNLLCDRKRTAELFGFDHRLEIYTPVAKRVWGYYVLPILHGERFVARADLKLDRAAGRLDVLALHHEPGRRAPGAVKRAVEQLARWRKAEVAWGSSP